MGKMSYLDDIAARLRPIEINEPMVPVYMVPAEFVSEYGMTKVSDKDRKTFRDNMLSIFKNPGPVEGEWIRFSNGVMARLSYVLRHYENVGTKRETSRIIGAQTSLCGHYHLFNGGTSMSGSLNSLVRYETMTLTDELKLGSVWIAHNGFVTRSCSVDGAISFRVWETNTEIPREYQSCKCGCLNVGHTYYGDWFPWCPKCQTKCM